MSQAGILSTTNGPVPANVATSYTTDNGTAVPSANVLQVRAIDVTDNNVNGIQVEGGLVEAGASNRVQIQLTNRVQGTGSTAGAVTADLVTLSLGATPGVFSFDVKVAGFNSSTPAGAGYSLFYTFRTDGASATLVDNVDRINHEEAALNDANATAVASGNNMIIRVTGVAALNINWNCDGYYTFVS